MEKEVYVYSIVKSDCPEFNNLIYFSGKNFFHKNHTLGYENECDFYDMVENYLDPVLGEFGECVFEANIKMSVEEIEKFLSDIPELEKDSDFDNWIKSL